MDVKFNKMIKAGLTQWLNGKRKAMPFTVAMAWRELKDHHISV